MRLILILLSLIVCLMPWHAPWEERPRAAPVSVLLR